MKKGVIIITMLLALSLVSGINTTESEAIGDPFVTTDRYTYCIGEPVTITIIGLEYHSALGNRWFIIEDENGDRVVDNSMIVRAMALMPIPDGIYSETWDQTYYIFGEDGNITPPTGEQVPDGIYYAWYGWGEKLYGPAEFKIVDCTNPNCSKVNRFSSFDEMKEYIGNRTYFNRPDYYHVDGVFATSGITMSASSTPPGFSGTNIQVRGVDEIDFVKTDGKYIYVISGDNVVIVHAYPHRNAQIVSKILSENELIGLYVNGERLVVFERVVQAQEYPDVDCYSFMGDCAIYYYYRESTSIKVYDISDRSNPKLDQNVLVSGNYINSRMLGDYVYLIASQSPWDKDGNVTLPEIKMGEKALTIGANDVAYFEEVSTHSSNRYTIVVALNIKDKKDLNYEIYLLEPGYNMYVSELNIYLAGGGYGGNSTIHKIFIAQGKICYVASGQVPGSILNQFSMDEYKSHLRVATQIWNTGTNVFVLDDMLNIVGRLEGIAPGEQMHSARFMKERCYLVTFKKVDPFFVIDLTHPEVPTILGELKIPGYSDYLHPYDEHHIIGVGKDTYDMGSFAWYQGIKIALFDVTDVNNPKEKAKYIIGDRGTNSDVLYDHKAFLFSKSKNLLILPINLAEIDESKYPDGVPPQTLGNFVWQGAYVFSLTPNNGFALKGRITHLNETSQLGQRRFMVPIYYNDCTHNYYVKRSLFIDNNIYTISRGKIKINRLDNLEELKEIDLGLKCNTPSNPIYPTFEPITFGPIPLVQVSPTNTRTVFSWEEFQVATQPQTVEPFALFVLCLSVITFLAIVAKFLTLGLAMHRGSRK